MPKYHRGAGGNWQICKATKRACPFRESPHVSDEELDRSRVGTFLELESRVGSVKETVRLAPANVSSEYCTHCNHYLPPSYILDMGEDETWVQCFNCQEGQAFDDYGVDLRESEVKYLSDTVVRTSHWFHVTSRQDWDTAVRGEGDEEEGDGPVMVHLGSREAAMERMRYLSSFATHADEPYYLYEVRLLPDAPIAPGLFEDSNMWPSNEYEDPDLYQRYELKGATRYLNRYENAGTVSLMANGTCFETVTRVQIAGI